ncbi:YdcF family protein [bacterium]
MAMWLHVQDPLEKADAIYVYGGGVIERPVYAAKLYREGYAPTVVVGGILMDSNLIAIGHYLNDGDINRKVVVKRGVPGKRIVQIWEGTSTYEETESLKKYILQNKLKSVILVTSPFHTRRVRMCARRVFKDTGVKLIVTSVPDPEVNLENWWVDERDLVNIAVEFIKITYYFIKFR